MSITYIVFWMTLVMGKQVPNFQYFKSKSEACHAAKLHGVDVIREINEEEIQEVPCK